MTLGHNAIALEKKKEGHSRVADCFCSRCDRFDRATRCTGR